MWWQLVTGAVLILGAYLLVVNWNEVIDQVASWARIHGYHGVINVLCTIENVRAGIRQLTFRAYDKKRDTYGEEIISKRYIKTEDLPHEFQYTGSREHKIII